MKSVDKLKRIIRVSRRITVAETMEANMQVFEGLGLDADDVEQMAESVGLKAEDLLLMNTHVTVGMDQRVAPPGSPGRKKTTVDIAEFARLGRLRGLTWNRLFDKCKRLHPDDKRVKHPDNIRDAHRRYFGDKAQKG